MEKKQHWKQEAICCDGKSFKVSVTICDVKSTQTKHARCGEEEEDKNKNGFHPEPPQNFFRDRSSFVPITARLVEPNCQEKH